MKILLLNVHFEQNVNPQLYFYLLSLTLRQLAAMTPRKHEIHIIDDVKPKNLNYEKDYDVVGISTVTPAALYAYKIADEFRRRGKIVVLGGYHPTAMPFEAKQYADSIVIGEAELLWPQLLKDLEEEKIKPYYKNEELVDPLFIPNPERKKFEKCTYIATVESTRGCPIGCEFCSISHKKFGNVYRKKPIEKIVEDIKSVKEKFIFFADSSLTIDVEYTKQLFKSLKNLNKKLIYCQGNVNVLARDDELLKLARDAGCVDWHVGFESISQATLEKIHKTTNKVEDYVKAIKKIGDYGMLVFGEFVFGFDTDMPDIFERTEETIKDWDVIPGFQVLVPYPGSPLFSRLMKEGRILTRDWSKYTISNAVFQPKHMTPEQLEEGVDRLFREFYSVPKTVKRMVKSMKLGFYPFIRAQSIIASVPFIRVLGN